MKKFEMPTLDVEKLDVEDVITTSVGCDGFECGNDAGEF